MKNIIVIIAMIAVAFTFASCQKKAEEPAEQKSQMAKGPIIDTQAGAGAPHGMPTKSIEFQVVVPDDVQAGWDAVTFVIEDKKENKNEEITSKIGEEFIIPGSKLTVKTGPFLPDFKMSASTITSLTNEPKNPAVGVQILDDGKKVFPPSGEWGWLYMNFPTIHSFQHERYGLLLKEGVKK